MKLRLHQFLSKTGAFSSKREILDAIHAGKVLVATKVITDAAYQFDPKKKPVRCNGRELELPLEFVYYVFYKPVGYICSRLNSQELQIGKKSIFAFFEKLSPKIYASLYNVGRLDEDTSGLLIMTTDGKLGITVTDPRSEIPKTYEVTLDKPILQEHILAIEKGLPIMLEKTIHAKRTFEEYQTKPCTIKNLNGKIQITITEGKKREIRKLFEAVGYTVQTLHRISIADLVLSDYKIKSGEFVEISRDHIFAKLRL